MHKVTLYGGVLPKSLKFTTAAPSKASWVSIHGLAVDVILSAKDGEVEIECAVETETLSREVLGDLLNGASDVLFGIVDLHVIMTGSGLTPYIDQVLLPGNTVRQGLNKGEARAAGVITAFANNPHGLAFLVLNDSQLRLLISDAAMALRLPSYQVIACGRAVDGIRVYLNPKANPEKGWTRMRDTLNISKPYLRFITDRAGQARHRERLDFSAAECEEIIHRTWVLINRLLEYCEGGKAPLSDLKHPLLSE